MGPKRQKPEQTMRAARYHPVRHWRISCAVNANCRGQETNTCQIDEIPIPSITDNEILVKVASASLCHSDLMLFEGSIPATEPVVMGHEGVGFVEDIGENVTGFKKGDRIGFLYIKGCCCKLFPLIMWRSNEMTDETRRMCGMPCAQSQLHKRHSHDSRLRM